MCEKERKCLLRAFIPFLTMFSKAISFSVVKCQDCVVKVNSLPKIWCFIHLEEDCWLY